METKNSPCLAEAFDTLLATYKTHTRAAMFIGITAGHYRKLRHGRVNISPRIAELIILKARDATSKGLEQPALADSTLSSSGQSVTV